MTSARKKGPGDGVTEGGMHAHRDREDARLLAAGDHAPLFATYFPVIRQRVVARGYPPADADDLVGRIIERLWRELSRGRTYDVPYRVVVHQVVGWECARFHRGPDAFLPDGADPGMEDSALHQAEERWSLEQLLADLPLRERQVAWLVYVAGHSVQDAARELGITRNNADQALHRARNRLRKAWP